MKLNSIFIILILITNYIYKNKNKNYKNFIKKKYIIKKGKYNTTLGNCISCHTVQGGPPFAGGVSIKTPFGVINTPNITFSKSGIKNINFKNFVKIIKYGISKKNEFLYPIFPYMNYYNIKKKDIKSIYKFLKTIPKINFINKKNYINFPFKYRKLLLGWRIMFMKIRKIKILKKQNQSINRGKYLTETLGHCNMCHSQINILGNMFKKFKYLGGIIKPENWYAVSLINNNFTIKKSLKELSNILKLGSTKNSSIIGSMSEVINNSLQYLSKIDIIAISNYIKILFNENIFKKKSKNPLKINKFFFQLIFNKGKLLYKTNCLNCHGSLGLGKPYNTPSINKNILNKEFLNNILNIFKLPNKTFTLKNSLKNIMPNFIFLNNNICKKILNYLYFIKYLNKN